MFGVGHDTSLQVSEHQVSSCPDQKRSEQQVFCGLHRETMVWVDVRIISEPGALGPCCQLAGTPCPFPCLVLQPETSHVYKAPCTRSECPTGSSLNTQAFLHHTTKILAHAVRCFIPITLHLSPRCERDSPNTGLKADWKFSEQRLLVIFWLLSA